MSNTYAFYQAGMRLIDFSVTSDQVLVTRHDRPTASPQPLTPTLATELGAIMHFDPAQALARLPQFGRWQPAMRTGTTFTTTWQATYERRDAHYWLNRHARPALDIIVDDAGTVVGYQQTQRAVTSVLVQPAWARATVVAAWQNAHMMRSVGTLGRRFTAMVPMRDGTRLATEVLLPATTQPVAAIMERTPYGRNQFIPGYQRFAHRGYAVIVQDVRGREDSEGPWIPFQYERDDANDTLNWIAAQPWNNGRVGMIGGSYGGYTQWAAAASGNPHLQAIVSMVTAGGAFTDTFAHGGAPSMAQLAWFFSVSGQRFQPNLMHRDDWDQLLRTRPIADIPQVGLGHAIPGYTAYLQHPTYDEFMANTDWHARADHIHVPAFIQSGWFDDDAMGTIEALDVTRNYAPGQRHILLGPWLHGGNAQYDLDDLALPANAIRHDVDLLHTQWFDHFLRGVDNGIDRQPTAEYFTMNANQWHTADTFPPSAPATQWPLDATTAGFGAQPGSAHVDYDYDPNDPAPQLVDVSGNEFEFPTDYAHWEHRSDVVSFTSPPLTNAITINGRLTLHFFASSSAVDTDWAIRATDVSPDGHARNVTDGIMNAKFRHDPRHAEYLTPGAINEYTLATLQTSYQFLPGHRLRLDVTSAASNLIFPNPNTRAGLNGTTSVVAHQRIYTGSDYPSTLSFNAAG
ncbi:CocE/NonD family hydrolase [Lacticaseibacillus thailandensis]|nr:CocE/NonD family hydrolase [Lacticaseibacillus thailandensis]